MTSKEEKAESDIGRMRKRCMITVHQSKRNKAVKQELLLVEKQEKRMAQAAMKSKPATWKTALKSRIPQKVYTGLESAFCKRYLLKQKGDVPFEDTLQ